MVSNYPLILHNILNSLSPRQVSNPSVVLLTPGVFNSAYYEHNFSRQANGDSAGGGPDLMVDNHKVYEDHAGTRQVDVIYRRIDDDFMDPPVFNPRAR
jgi:uncharacterized circularly permuted ATP-grasp superfamily protein